MESFLPTIIAWIESSKYALLFVGMIAEGPVIMLASGFLYHLGQFQFWPMYLTLVAGDFTADLGWYALGRYGTKKFIFKHSHLFNITETTLVKMEKLFHQYHEKILILSKLTMGFGFAHIVLIVAGIFKIPFKSYVILNGIGGFIWTGILVSIGYFLGNAYVHIPGSSKILFLISVFILIVLGVRYLNNYLQTKEL